MSKSFSPKDPSEAIIYGIDFAALCAHQETLVSAVCTMRVLTGADSNPADMLSGNPAITGFVVKQKVVGGVLGCGYQLSITVVTSSGQTFVEGAPIHVIERN